MAKKSNLNSTDHNIRPWKSNILEARKIRGKSMDLLYDRMTLLCQTFDDLDFREENGFDDDLEAAEYLDKEVDEFQTIGSRSPFLTLRALIQRFPDKSQWSGNSLRAMLQKMDEESQQAREHDPPARQARRATIKELEDAVKRAEYAETTVRNLQERTEQRKTELERALARIRELEDENATLRGRISELERIVNRQLIAA